jgi:hypothetical protein
MWMLLATAAAAFCSSSFLAASSASVVHVNFGVLLPEQFVSPIAQGPCVRLGWARAEQDLVADEISRLLGGGWTMARGGRALESASSSAAGGELDENGYGSAAVRITLSYNDTQCSDTYGPYAAMEIYYRNRIDAGVSCHQQTAFADASRSSQSRSISVADATATDVWAFYGLCCKYVLSPVGRYAKLWDVPIITSGGMTRFFSNRTSFPLLVRIVPPYNKLASFMVSLLSLYKWRHTALIYHDNLGTDKSMGSSECQHVIDALMEEIDPAENLDLFASGSETMAAEGSGTDESTSTDGGESAAEDAAAAALKVGGICAEDDAECHAASAASMPFEVPHIDVFNEARLDSFNVGGILNGISENARSK